MVSACYKYVTTFVGSAVLPTKCSLVNQTWRGLCPWDQVHFDLSKAILVRQWWDRLSSISIFMRFDFNFGCILIGLHYEEYFMFSFVLEDPGRNPAFGHGLRKRAFTFLSWAANFSGLCVQVSGSRLSVPIILLTYL